MNGEGEGRGANPLELRRDIDKGLTGDKVDFPDPAAAPLGTDDEAAGTPITQAQLDAARRAERAHGRQSEGKAAGDSGTRLRSRRVTVIVALAALLSLLLLVLAIR